MANIRRIVYAASLVPPKTCRVSVTDPRGVVHSVEVPADTLFEAAAKGLAALKKDYWTEPVGTSARIQVEVLEPAVTHTLTVMQLERWLQGATSSPNEAVQKRRLSELLRG
jgi:hypothetical protein